MRWLRRCRKMQLVKAVDHIRPGIVQIGFVAEGLSAELRNRLGRPFVRSCLGTGFFVNSDGYVVTARHVIQLAQRLGEQIAADRKNVFVGLAMPNTEKMRGNFCGVGFDLVDEDARHDLALLKLKQNPFRGEVRSAFRVKGAELPLLFATVTLNPNRPKDGDAVAVSGYPLGQPVLVTSAGWMATSWSFDITETPVLGAPEWSVTLDVADYFLADIEVNPGNSGGPLYVIEDASVIGICVASMPSPVRDQEQNPVSQDDRRLFYSSGLTKVVPSRYIIDLLNRHGLTWSE